MPEYVSKGGRWIEKETVALASIPKVQVEVNIPVPKEEKKPVTKSKPKKGRPKKGR